MRKWNKYILNYESVLSFLQKDVTYCDHKNTMGGYNAENGYGNKEEFFRVYFYSQLRFKYYHDYLKENLKKSEKVLSIGSGRCINELLLAEEGFDITCSDLDQPCREKTDGASFKRQKSRHRWIRQDRAESGGDFNAVWR